MFYTMLALRAELRERGAFSTRPEPNLGELLDLVALGTVADVVKLDHNNRILVAQGLARMRAGRMQAGIRALFAAAGRESQRANTFDLGFALGPRLNAAGRLSDRLDAGAAALLMAWERLDTAGHAHAESAGMRFHAIWNIDPTTKAFTTSDRAHADRLISDLVGRAVHPFANLPPDRFADLLRAAPTEPT